MPIHFSPLSRRQFLATGSAAATLTMLRPVIAADDVDANVFALLSDTHIPNRTDVVAHQVNMTDNFRRVVADLCALAKKPAGVIVNGDCAYLRGLAEDYGNFASCAEPLADAGLPLHLTMGNHDHRERLYDALASQRPMSPPVQSKHVSVIPSHHANLFLLDSLREVNVVTGELGEAQRKWLADALDAHQDKPAIVIAHHNPQFQAPPEGERWTGLMDSAALFELLAQREHVKAYVYGHTHRWSHTVRDGLHLINLPPVAYVFDSAEPNGWVQATLRAGGLDLRLMTFDPAHPKSQQHLALDWS